MPRSAAERVSRDPSSPWWAEHVARYRFAAPVARGRVLDVACGSGIGFGELEQATMIVAGDADAVAVADASTAPSTVPPDSASST